MISSSFMIGFLIVAFTIMFGVVVFMSITAESKFDKDEKKIKKLNNAINHIREKVPKKLTQEEEIEKQKRKRLFEQSRKERFKQFQQNNIQKGKDYELFIGKYYQDKKYQVSYHGQVKKLKDRGVDLVAYNQEEILLIQCKNWKQDSKQLITEKEIRSFLGGCETYINNNPTDKIIKKIFIMAHDVLSPTGKEFIQENQNLLEIKIQKYI